MNYGEVLSSSWRTIWKHKVLWIFGFLAALGGGSSGGSSGGGGGGGGSGNGFPGTFNPQLNEWLQQVNSWLQSNWWVILVLAAVIFLFVILLTVLSTFGQIGLVRGAWKADEGTQKLRFGPLFAESGRYFWRVVGFTLLVFVVGLVIIMVLGLGAVAGVILTLGVGLLCLIPFLCIFVLVAWLAGIIIRLTVVSIVGEDKGIFEALSGVWDTARGHLGEVILMGLILGLGGGLVQFFIAIPFFFAFFPVLIGVFMDTGEAMRATLLASAALFCLYLPIAMFLGSVVEAYLGTAWTLTYRRLTGRGPALVEVLPAAPVDQPA